MWCYRKNVGLEIKKIEIFDLILLLFDGGVCIGEGLVLKSRIFFG